VPARLQAHLWAGYVPLRQVRNVQEDHQVKIHLSEKEFLESEIKRLEHNEEVLMNALFKACGDDAQVVEEIIESQGVLK
jgi:hypothetical protein